MGRRGAEGARWDAGEAGMASAVGSLSSEGGFVRRCRAAVWRQEDEEGQGLCPPASCNNEEWVGTVWGRVHHEQESAGTRASSPLRLGSGSSSGGEVPARQRKRREERGSAGTSSSKLWRSGVVRPAVARVILLGRVREAETAAGMRRPEGGGGLVSEKLTFGWSDGGASGRRCDRDNAGAKNPVSDRGKGGGLVVFFVGERLEEFLLKWWRGGGRECVFFGESNEGRKGVVPGRLLRGREGEELVTRGEWGEVVGVTSS